MGRPASTGKNEEDKDIIVNQNQEIDIQALIKQVTEEVTKQIEDKYENKINELKQSLDNKTIELEQATITNTKKKYKFIPDNTKVRIQSNVDGKFLFTEDRGKIRVFVQLDNFEDSAVISYEELRTMYSSKPSFIKKGQIAITDVYSDEDIEIEDILKDLRLDNIYDCKNKIDPRYIRDLLTDKVNEKDFMSLINNTPEMAETVVEIAYILYRQGLFNDNAKMNFLRQIYRNQNLFK
jgi:hypothetical protein